MEGGVGLRLSAEVAEVSALALDGLPRLVCAIEGLESALKERKLMRFEPKVGDYAPPDLA
jgi:hypothetical protein